MKEKLGFGTLGNGIIVWDSSREVGNDYPTVAHIGYDRTVTYYQEVSPQARIKIENCAKYENTSASHTQPDHLVLRPIADSAFMSPADKGSFLRDYGCSTDGVGPFIRDMWDDTKPPLENLEQFRRWWAAGKAGEYLG